MNVNERTYRTEVFETAMLLEWTFARPGRSVRGERDGNGFWVVTLRDPEAPAAPALAPPR